ncbi:MAG: GDP-L-fucose synthase [Bacteroidales bacterium]|jgi:GDP-L-fucose synthase|nr:GDP-L-fucose synthase [Bacteroidales bacterium]HHT52069.1 GDP-L-fucose synthase [Bacteroidales bacterium]
MNLNSKIYVAGHLGLVGSAIVRQLRAEGYHNLLLKSSKEVDLTNQELTHELIRKEKPDYIFVAAAKVGGILANNTYRAQFIYENLMIQNNLIHAAKLNNTKKLLFLGSSCIYPKDAPQPIREEALLTGVLEYTNEPYAIAKIAGIKMCESYYHQYGSNFISVMPTNLYGENDNYDLETSHVLPAMIRKMHLGKLLFNDDWAGIYKDLKARPMETLNDQMSKEEIKTQLNRFGLESDKITLWGTGQVYREFLHVDDMARGVIHIMKHVSADQLYKEKKISHINIGTGIDLTIKQLAELIQQITDYKGKIVWDHSKPDGTYKKQLDITRLKEFDFTPAISLEEGIRLVYQQYMQD